MASAQEPVLVAHPSLAVDDRPKAVLDSSVLVGGWSRLVLQRLASASPPHFEPVWSEWIIAETWRVLAWRACKAGASALHISRQANRMLEHLLPVIRPVVLHQYAGPPPWPSLADPDDEPIWATAVLGQARYVVSDNTTDFPPLVEVSIDSNPRNGHVYDGIEYLTAIEFVEDVLQVDAGETYGADLPRVLTRSGRSRNPARELLNDDN